MASASIVSYPQPAGLASLYSSPDRLPQPLSSTPLVDPIASATSSVPLDSTRKRRSSLLRSATDVFPEAAQGALAAAKVSSDSARLHKRTTSKSSRHSRKSSANNTPVLGYSSTFTSPILPQDAFRPPSPKPSPKAKSKDKLKNTFRKPSVTEDDAPTIDFSRTTQENEERTGLAISSSHATSVLSSGRAHRRHTRTASQQSDSSDALWPALPMRPALDPDTPFFEKRSYSSPMLGSNALGDAHGSRAVSDNSERSSAADVSKSSFGTPSRPRLRVNTSEGLSGRRTSTSHSNLSHGSASNTRPRPLMSAETAHETPTSRTSATTDRAFGLLKGTSREASTIDPDTRAATIQAARVAFEEKQEAKNRKYEQRERRASEKKARKAAQQAGRSRKNTSTAEHAPAPTMNPHDQDSQKATKAPLKPRFSGMASWLRSHLSSSSLKGGAKP